MTEGTLVAASQQQQTTLQQYNSIHSNIAAASFLNQQNLKKQNIIGLERIHNTTTTSAYANNFNGEKTTNYGSLAINNLVNGISNLDMGKNGNNNLEQKSSSAMRLPGSWFYEVGPEESSGTGSAAASIGLPGECSPLNDYEDLQQLNRLKLELGSRNITESVEVIF